MTKSRKMKTSFLFGLVAVLALCVGITLSAKPAPTVQAQTLDTTNWTLATEGDYEFRIQNGTVYWTTGEGTNVTPELY